MTKENRKISDFVEKTLLKAVEKKNLPRSQVDLIEILDSNVEVFGGKGDDRRDIQSHWYNLKRMSIRKYRNRVLSHDLLPSQATEIEFTKNGRCPSPEDSSITSDAESANGGDDGGLAELGNAFRKSVRITARRPKEVGKSPSFQVQNTPPSPPTIAYDQPANTSFSFGWNQQMPISPQQTPLFPQPTAFSPGRTTAQTKQVDGGSPAPSIASTNSSSSLYSYSYETLPEANIQGTEFNPVPVPIVLNRPEASYPFLVEHNPRRVEGGYTYETLHITKDISGPWRAGKHDREIFGEESGLRSLIPEEKVVVCDRVYRNKGKDGNGNDILALPNIGDSAGLFTFKSRLRSRHESLNGRLKDFKILSDTFHHPHGMHKYAFEAVCVLVQFSMDHGHPLFDANTVTLDDE